MRAVGLVKQRFTLRAYRYLSGEFISSTFRRRNNADNLCAARCELYKKQTAAIFQFRLLFSWGLPSMRFAQPGRRRGNGSPRSVTLLKTVIHLRNDSRYFIINAPRRKSARGSNRFVRVRSASCVVNVPWNSRNAAGVNALSTTPVIVSRRSVRAGEILTPFTRNTARAYLSLLRKAVRLVIGPDARGPGPIGFTTQLGP